MAGILLTVFGEIFTIFTVVRQSKVEVIVYQAVGVSVVNDVGYAFFALILKYCIGWIIIFASFTFAGEVILYRQSFNTFGFG